MTQVCGCVAALAVGGLLLVLVGGEIQSSAYIYVLGAGAAAVTAAVYLKLR